MDYKERLLTVGYVLCENEEMVNECIDFLKSMRYLPTNGSTALLSQHTTFPICIYVLSEYKLYSFKHLK